MLGMLGRPLQFRVAHTTMGVSQPGLPPTPAAVSPLASPNKPVISATIPTATATKPANEGSNALHVDHQRPVIGDRHQLRLDGTAAQAGVIGEDVVELAAGV